MVSVNVFLDLQLKLAASCVKSTINLNSNSAHGPFASSLPAKKAKRVLVNWYESGVADKLIFLIFVCLVVWFLNVLVNN